MELSSGKPCKSIPNVHAEILANIQSVLVVVGDSYSADEYELTSSVLLHNGTPIVNFPAPVYTQDFKPQNVAPKSFSFRLRLTSAVASSDNDESTTLLSSKDLKDISVIACKECRALISSHAFPAVKDLPSDHWMELVECWICHETSEKEHSGQLKPIVARENLLLIGSTYLLLHPNDVRNVKIDDHIPAVHWEKVIAFKWIPIVCSSCNSALGEKQYTISQHDTGVSPNAQAVKLYKYAVIFNADSEPQASSLPVTSFVNYVVMDFVELFSAHATYKFLIHNRSDESIHGLLWVFNPDIQVYNQNIGERGGWQRAMKVLYIDCQQDTSAANRQIEKWKVDKSVDRLLYPGKYCRQLFAILNENNLHTPEHLRRAAAGSPLADFRFAYLKR